MANETTPMNDMFSKYVEGKLHIKLSDGNVLDVLVTPRDKMIIVKHHNSARPDAIDQIYAHISTMVSRAYPDIPKEHVDALVIMQSEAITKALIVYLELLTEKEYTDRRNRMLGVEGEKNPNAGAIPSDAPAKQ